MGFAALNQPPPSDAAPLIQADALARRYGITPTKAFNLNAQDIAAANAGAAWEQAKGKFANG